MADQSKTARAPMVKTVDAVVVGGGFGGMYQLHRLRELGLSLQGFEAGDDVGGTWYWNRYPGARCDVPSLFYSFTFSEALTREWRWSEKYAAQPEILRYAGHIADRYGLRDLIAFQTRVTKAVFDEGSNQWLIETDRGDQVRARWCVMATGCLSVPQEPQITGAESFKGPIYHTGRWPHEPVDFTGQRVGVIGTGSSGIQSIPEIAKQAMHVTVFQRTANYSLPANNGPLTDADYEKHQQGYAEYLELLKAGAPGVIGGAETAPIPPLEKQRHVYQKHWDAGGTTLILAFPNVLTSQEVNDVASDFVREKIKAKVKDPAVAEKLSPRGHPIGTKRICVDLEYFETFNRANVSLVDVRAAPIQAITPTGLRTTEADYELDAIVLATGFDAMTGALLAMDITGVGGARLDQAWAGGPAAYLGLTVAGFPNLFMVTGPGSPSVLSNMLVAIEQHVDWISDAIAHMRAKGLNRIEAQPDAQAAWVAHVKATADSSLFPKANSWYMGANIPGKPRVFPIYIGDGYRRKCEDVAAKGYEGFTVG